MKLFIWWWFSPTLATPDCNLPGSSVNGILQARILEWVAIPFSRGSSRPRDWTQVSWIAGRFFTIWAMRETPQIIYIQWSNEVIPGMQCWFSTKIAVNVIHHINGLKKQKSQYHINSCEKSIWQNSISIMVKALREKSSRKTGKLSQTYKEHQQNIYS